VEEVVVVIQEVVEVTTGITAIMEVDKVQVHLIMVPTKQTQRTLIQEMALPLLLPFNAQNLNIYT
jgi:hypothetical protein